MKAINPNEIKDNFIELIGKEWMLVSAGDKEKFNMMTASWGGVGVLWNRPVVFAFIRSERYTREFIDAKNEFTITFLGPEHRKAHSICGSKSGREIDKVDKNEIDAALYGGLQPKIRGSSPYVGMQSGL